MAAPPKPKPRRISRRKPTRPTHPRTPPPAPEKKNGRALVTGAQATGENLPGYAETLAVIERIREEAPWIQETDWPLLEIFASEWTAHRHTALAFERMGDTARGKKLSAVKLQIRRSRVLGELADRLGLSPQSRFKLGLVVAKTEAIKVQPVRSEQRARAVAELLARSGALPPPAHEAEVVTDDAETTENPTPPDLKAVPEEGSDEA